MLSTHCADCPYNGRPQVRQDFMPGVDVLFLGAYPTKPDADYGPFSSKSGALLRNIITSVSRTQTTSGRFSHDCAYVCQCVPEYDAIRKKFNITAEIFDRCAIHIKDRIERQRPRVLVAMGADVLRILGFREKAGVLRGGIFSYSASYGKIPVVATFHIVQVHKQPGYVPTFEKDVRKALALSRNGISDVDMEIDVPKNPDEIIARLNAIIDAAVENRKRAGKPLALAVDTETTSLESYLPDERVIAVSMSHRARYGLAYPFEHRDCPFSEDDFKRIKDLTEKVISHPDIAIIMANGKFDQQWLAFHYGLKMNPVKYDVLLAEHVLDEDKKGEYSLKDLTCDRFPSMGKYEVELKNHLNDAWNAKDGEIRNLMEEHAKKCDGLVLEWWLGLDANERIEKLSPWIDRGLIDFSSAKDLCAVKYRKLRGEMVIPKKYGKAVLKLLRGIPQDELGELVWVPELVIPAELERRTYEDADLDILLRYAAIDALTTRLIADDQRMDFARDHAKIMVAGRELGSPLATRKCQDVMRDNTLPLSDCLARMEYNGVRIDREACAKYCETAREKMDEAREKMFTEVGRRFSTSSSSPDLGKILFDEMNLPVLRTTDSGAPSTDADTIKELADAHDLPFLRDLLVYRKIDKVVGTYLLPWLEKTGRDGFLHCGFNQMGTATYRLSSSNPWA